ncbi:hypothetical protein O9G_001086 [Rozella allomycis CSF55]|uniref:Uncharacterized protein n=1 Tax=Rozella allomycis (strain CSF55) TaxID=988480 RepID=A0A075AR44_ROZAC|nr:hypothetical protein O9G_001086 [Rozella allomycis CSF55]|eukprot:EPZ31175.1 hypothetical protein O9G_001086 [Rozella allomycis CSF55]
MDQKTKKETTTIDSTVKDASENKQAVEANETKDILSKSLEVSEQTLQRKRPRKRSFSEPKVDPTSGPNIPDSKKLKEDM